MIIKSQEQTSSNESQLLSVDYEVEASSLLNLINQAQPEHFESPCDIPEFDWNNKWLKGYQYASILNQIDQYCQLYNFRKYPLKCHPEEIYQEPQNGLIYFIEGNCLGSQFGFPRVPQRKTYTWKKMNFTTDIPKQKPEVTYIVATSSYAHNPRTKSQQIKKELNTIYRMHAVILYKNKNEQELNPSTNTNQYILCHIRKIHVSKELPLQLSPSSSIKAQISSNVKSSQQQLEKKLKQKESLKRKNNSEELYVVNNTENSYQDQVINKKVKFSDSIISDSINSPIINDSKTKNQKSQLNQELQTATIELKQNDSLSGFQSQLVTPETKGEIKDSQILNFIPESFDQHPNPYSPECNTNSSQPPHSPSIKASQNTENRCKYKENTLVEQVVNNNNNNKNDQFYILKKHIEQQKESQKQLYEMISQQQQHINSITQYQQQQQQQYHPFFFQQQKQLQFFPFVTFYPQQTITSLTPEELNLVIFLRQQSSNQPFNNQTSCMPLQREQYQ